MATCADRQYQRRGTLEPKAKPVRLASHEELLEGYLANVAFSDNPRLAELVRAMRRALLSKRVGVHSILCLEVAEVFGLRPRDVLPAAAAIEFVHTLSAIHADLPALGGDERLRGGRACHEEFGEATAILAGDGFLGTSLGFITREQRGTPGQLLAVVRELARSAGIAGTIGGQALEATYAGRTVDPETLDVIHAHKTGALFEASALIGAILAGATSGERQTIAGYARHLGICFRIVEDVVLSRTSSDLAPRTIERADDAGRGAVTFPAVYGLRGALHLADESLGGALGALDGIDRDTAGLAELAFGVRRGEYSAGARMRARRDV